MDSETVAMDGKGSTGRESRADYDVVVIGGAFAGASAALLLKRRLPHARILVVELLERFSHKVGEATVEVSSLFLHRVLGLYDHLSREHLPKHGLRYWFADGPTAKLGEMSEVGPREAPRLPSFQLDRSKLDEHLLSCARDAGVEIARPARIAALELDWPESRVEIEADGDSRSVTTRWVVDASGRSAFIARRQRLLERTERHPIAATWARWHGVADLDGARVLGDDARSPSLRPIVASRRLATNHFCGRGWWCWVIPLSNGKTSIGLVWNKELFEPPGEGRQRERYEAFVRSSPGLRELVEGARLDDDDLMSYSHIPYKASQYMGRGWALVGDAAAFMDPYYSPGLDHVSMSVWSTVGVVESDLRAPEDDAGLERRMSKHNEAFERSYDRWLDALYVGKYELMGDAELTSAAFLIDTSLYYLGVVGPAFKNLDSLENPVFGVALPQATIAYRITRAINRRLQRLAALRRRRGTYGRRNRGWRLYPPPFALGRGALGPLRQGLGIWLRLELETLLRLPWGERPLAEPAHASASPATRASE